MLTLTIETATQDESVAVVAHGELLAERTTRAGRGRADELTESVADVLSSSSLALAGLDAIAVSIGPGRFTGLRVGLATAKGLSAATGVPILPVPTLEALAASAPPDDLRDGAVVCAMLDARRGEVYSALFRLGAMTVRLLPDVAAAPAAAAALAVEASGGSPVVFVGTGASLYSKEIAKSVGVRGRFPSLPTETPGPIAMARIAERQAASGPVDLASLTPVYLRGL